MAWHWTLHVATTNLCVMSFRGWAFPCPVLLQVSPYSFPVLSSLMTLNHLFPALPKPWHLPGSASVVDGSIAQLGIEQCSLLPISQLLLPFRFLLPFFSSSILQSLTYLPNFPYSCHLYFYQQWFYISEHRRAHIPLWTFRLVAPLLPRFQQTLVPVSHSILIHWTEDICCLIFHCCDLSKTI